MSDLFYSKCGHGADDECPRCAPVDDLSPTEREDRDAEDLATGRRWRADSSLETWFPYTAEELSSLTAELEALRADALRYRWLRENYASVGFEGRMLLWDQRDPAAALDVYIDEARKGAA